MMRTEFLGQVAGQLGTRDNRMRRSRSGLGKSMCRNRQRRLTPRTVHGGVGGQQHERRPTAVSVPSSGTVTAKSDGARRPSISMSVLSVSSMRGTSARCTGWRSAADAAQELLAERVVLGLIPVAGARLDAQICLAWLAARCTRGPGGAGPRRASGAPGPSRWPGRRHGPARSNAGGTLHQQRLAEPVGRTPPSRWRCRAGNRSRPTVARHRRCRRSTQLSVLLKLLV